MILCDAHPLRPHCHPAGTWQGQHLAPNLSPSKSWAPCPTGPSQERRHPPGAGSILRRPGPPAGTSASLVPALGRGRCKLSPVSTSQKWDEASSALMSLLRGLHPWRGPREAPAAHPPPTPCCRTQVGRPTLQPLCFEENRGWCETLLVTLRSAVGCSHHPAPRGVTAFCITSASPAPARLLLLLRSDLHKVRLSPTQHQPEGQSSLAPSLGKPLTSSEVTPSCPLPPLSLSQTRTHTQARTFPVAGSVFCLRAWAAGFAGRASFPALTDKKPRAAPHQPAQPQRSSQPSVMDASQTRRRRTSFQKAPWMGQPLRLATRPALAHFHLSLIFAFGFQGTPGFREWPMPPTGHLCPRM